MQAVSEDDLLKLTIVLEKTSFATSPRESVEINLTVTNIGDQDITMTFHCKSKFDFVIWDYTQGAYAYRWSYDHVQGPVGWSADASVYPISITLEPPDVSLIMLRSGEGISQLSFWNQYYSGGGQG